MISRVLSQAEEILSICPELRLDKQNNFKVVKLGSCTVNVLIQFQIKHYIFRVSLCMVLCTLSIKLKKHVFPEVCMCEFLC